MPNYILTFHPAAKKELDKLDFQIKLFIVKALEIFINSYNHNAEFEKEMIKN